MQDTGRQTDPPDSIEKGLLQLLWTARPWIRNALLILVGAAVLIFTVVPESVRDALILSMFHVETPPAHDDNDDAENPHVRRLPSGHVVRLFGKVQQNDSNVADRVIQHAIEFDTWRYLDCYEGAYGAAKAPPPAGTAVVDFFIRDQLPVQVKLRESTFDSEPLGHCIETVVVAETLNQAGAQGQGHVSYAFQFKPN